MYRVCISIADARSCRDSVRIIDWSFCLWGLLLTTYYAGCRTRSNSFPRSRPSLDLHTHPFLLFGHGPEPLTVQSARHRALLALLPRSGTCDRSKPPSCQSNCQRVSKEENPLQMPWTRCKILRELHLPSESWTGQRVKESLSMGVCR